MSTESRCRRYLRGTRAVLKLEPPQNPRRACASGLPHPPILIQEAWAGPRWHPCQGPRDTIAGGLGTPLGECADVTSCP